MRVKPNQNKYELIKKKKQKVCISRLCKGLPQEIEEYMNYSKNLEFSEEPNYRYLIGLFENCLSKNLWDPKIPSFIWDRDAKFKSSI